MMTQLSADDRTAPQPAAWLALPLLTLGTLHLRRGEIGQIVTHRYMLVVYLLVLPVLILLDTNPQAHGHPIEVRGPVYIVAIAATMLTIGGAIELAFLAGLHRLPLTPVNMLATLVALAASEIVSRLIFTAQGRGLGELALVCSFYFVMAEIVASVLLHNVMPMILGEIRQIPIGTLVETDPAFCAAQAQAREAQGRADATGAGEGFLVVAERSVAFASLRHLQAYGNYVLLHSRAGKELVAGPLSRLVAQIPAAYGKQVHRSHWVAGHALRGWSVSGREVDLWLDGETRVPVAVTRRREVLDWLAALGIRQGKPV